MKLNKDNFENSDIGFYEKYYTIDETHHFHQSRKAGESYYKLLMYISNMFSNIKIMDAGTFEGGSCLAFAQNKKNTVWTYDIIERNLPFLNDYKNVKSFTKNAFSETDDVLHSFDIIMVDTTHNGIEETEFINRLQDIDWSGYVICDDITSQWHPGMVHFWNRVQQNKFDVSEIGGPNGTGIICFNRDDVVIERTA
jgi:hypothetical protein